MGTGYNGSVDKSLDNIKKVQNSKDQIHAVSPFLKNLKPVKQFNQLSLASIAKKPIHILEEIEEEKTEERESVLADADYSEAEKVKHDENYGNEFVSKFVKNLPKSELHKEYKV